MILSPVRWFQTGNSEMRKKKRLMRHGPVLNPEKPKPALAFGSPSFGEGTLGLTGSLRLFTTFIAVESW
jgi:hypothetical protein